MYSFNRLQSNILNPQLHILIYPNHSEKLDIMRLKEVMKEKHISGSQLAKMTGVSSSYINAVTSGRANLSVKKCTEIAEALGVPVAALFEGYVKPGYVYCPHCGKPISLKGED